MKIFDHYYVTQDTEADKYSIEPTGPFDFNRLVNGKADFWISPTPETNLRPRHLVLNDWTLAHKDVSYLKAVYEKLLTLILPPHHFEVSMYQNGELVSLNKDNIELLFDLHKLQQIEPVPEDKIKRLMAQKGISQKDLLCLTPHEVRCLVKGEQVKEALYISDCHESCFEFEDILHSLDKKKRYLIQFGNYSYGINKWFNAHKKALEKHGDLSLGIDHIDRVISGNNFASWRNIDEEHNLTQIAGVKSLNISNLIYDDDNPICDRVNKHEPSHFSAVLKELPALEKLYLSYIDFLSVSKEPQGYDKHHIKELGLTHSSISWGELSDICNKSEVIEKVSLNYTHLSAIKTIGKDETDELTKKKSLELSLGSVKVLCVENCWLDNQDDFLKALSINEKMFTHLNSLTITDTEINEEILSTLLYRSGPKLKEINLALKSNNDPLFYLTDPKLDLSQLETLSLSYGAQQGNMPFTKSSVVDSESGLNSISWESIRIIVSKSKKLKCLSLTNSIITDDTLELALFNQADWSQLEELNLSGSELSFKTLKLITDHAVNLKKINLSKCKIIDCSTKHPPSIYVPNAKEINLSGHKVIHDKMSDKMYLNEILRLSNANKLETLDLSELNLCSLDKSEFELPHTLVNINLDDTIIKYKILLSQILNKKRKLALLKMNRARVLYEPVTGRRQLPVPPLPLLKTLDLSNIQMEGEYLTNIVFSLIYATQQLESLKLDGLALSSLSDVYVRNNSALFGSLKHLSLEKTKISIKPLLHLLRASSKLQTLNLHDTESIRFQFRDIYFMLNLCGQSELNAVLYVKPTFEELNDITLDGGLPRNLILNIINGLKNIKNFELGSAGEPIYARIREHSILELKGVDREIALQLFQKTRSAEKMVLENQAKWLSLSDIETYLHKLNVKHLVIRKMITGRYTSIPFDDKREELNVDTLSLYDSKLYQDELELLFKNMKKLKAITIKDSHLMTSIGIGINHNFEELESLTVTNTFFTTSFLMSLLTLSAVKLKEINIHTNNCEFRQDKDATLYVRGMYYDFSFLGLYIEKHAETRSLKISNCNFNVDYQFDREKMRNAKLADIEIKNTRLDTGFITELLLHTPKLQSINLVSIILTGDDLKKLNLIQNRAIRHLSINTSFKENNHQLLTCLLPFMPNLTDLSLVSTISKGVLPDFHTMNMKHLNSLYLTNFESTGGSFEKLLSDNHKGLINLTLHSVMIYDENREPFKLEPLVFENLSFLELYKTNISPETVFFIIINAPKLQHLSLDETLLESLYNMGLFNLDKHYEACLDKLTKTSLTNIKEKKEKSSVSSEVDTQKKQVKQAQAVKPQAKSFLSRVTDYLSSNTASDKRTTTSEAKTSVGSYSNKTQESVDFDTAYPEGMKYKIKRIIYSLDKDEKHPAVSFYRQDIYDDLSYTSSTSKVASPFLLSRKEPLKLTSRQIVFYPDDLKRLGQSMCNEHQSMYFADNQITVTPEWQPLTTIKPTDEITHFHAQPKDIEIQYSETYRQYYIRSKSTHPLRIQYLLKHHRKEETPVLPKKIMKLIEELKSFGQGSVSGVTSTTKPEMIIKKMYKQKKGSCRHRTVVFKHMMKTLYPNMPVHIINNSCHSFIQLNYQGTWLTINLGGYYVPKDILENKTRQAPKIIPSEPKVDVTELIHQPVTKPKKTQSEVVYVDPIHNPNQFYGTQQTKRTERFEFKGDNKTFNQSMIIEKLSQYIILTKQSKDIAKQIQDGICTPLSQLFKEISLSEWDQLMNVIHDWDGTKTQLTDKTNRALALLYKKIKQKDETRFSYIGAQLNDFMSTHKGTFEVRNPWHRITIKYDDVHHQWIVYDPNYVKGYKTVEPERIAKVINDALGGLVYIEGNHPYPLLACINDINHFLAEGGFHVLYFALLCGQTSEEFIDKSQVYPYHSLYGLYMRDVHDMPAWLNGINHPETRDVFLFYIRQLKQLNPDVFLEEMKKSLDGLNHQAQADALVLLSQYILTFTNQPDEMDETKYAQYLKDKAKADKAKSELLKESYKHYFTAVRTSDDALTLNEWLVRLLNDDVSKKLIELNSQDEANNLIRLVQQQAIRHQQPYYIVNRPEELICSAPWLQKEGDIGLVKKGPGGPLYDFIKAHQYADKSPIIILNYGHFTPQDIVRTNTIIDDIRKADGELLPDSFKVIGINNLAAEDVYQSADFYSRFNQRLTPQYDKNEIAEGLPEPLLDVNTALAPDCYHIELFNGQDWKEKLMGSWRISGQSLVYVEGELVKALSSRKPIIIHNPPNEEEAFQAFWRDLQLKGEIQGIAIPNKLYVTSGYPFKKWSKSHQFKENNAKNFYSTPSKTLLNQHTLIQFIRRYVCDNELKVIHPKMGLLQAHKEAYEKKKHMPHFECQVTSTLSESQWAMILHEANRLGLQIHFDVLPGVRLPESLSECIQAQQAYKEDAVKRDSQADVIISNDIDAASMLYQSSHPNTYYVIDGTEYKPHDVLVNLNAHFDKESLQFHFNEQKKVIVQLLEQGECVILKGPLKTSLREAIQPYLRDYPKQLVIISNNEFAWQAIPHKKHIITTQDKLLLLGLKKHDEEWTEEKVQSKSYIALKAEMDFKRRLSKERLEQTSPWDPLYRLSNSFNLGELDKDHYQEDIQEFNRQRLSLINNAFDVSPIICLSGITGVGKTTFIQNTLSEHTPVFLGDEHIKAWAKSGGGVLFIDEANMNQKEWSEFEGLFNMPPSIIINGEWFQLTEKHKVIFAFNPANYGAERKVNALFKRHPNTVIFNPLTLNVIYGLSLKPLFQGTMLERHAFDISSVLLSMYQAQLTSSHDKVSISIRDLKSIAMLIIAYHALYPQLDLHQLSCYLIKEVVGLDALTQKQHLAIEGFELPNQQTTPLMKDDGSDFIENKATRTISNALKHFLHLREYRLNNIAQLEAHQLNGGLGGFILEGESGLGKSHLVLNTLSEFGLTEADITTEEALTNVYYHIPVSMPVSQKKQLILKAFHEGNPVIMDEINSCVMMERLLNSLLMGKTPEGKWAKMPGFFIIGTQNPIYLKGRNAISEAQSKRVIKKIYPLYSSHEMITILLRKGLDHLQASSLVDVFLEKRQAAIVAESDTIPSFRDMLSLISMIEERAQENAKHINAFIHTLTKPVSFELSQLDPKIQCQLYQLSITSSDLLDDLIRATWNENDETFNRGRVERILQLIEMKGEPITSLVLNLPQSEHGFFLDYVKSTQKALLDSLKEIATQYPVFFQQLVAYRPDNQYQPARQMLLNELLETYYMTNNIDDLKIRLGQIAKVKPKEGIEKEIIEPPTGMNETNHEDMQSSYL